jgi:surface carbohydrate biosynthesis protein
MYIQTNVIFLYADSLRRDFSTCYIIKNKLDEKGFKSIICSRRNLSKFSKIFTPQKFFIIGQINIIPQEIIKNSIKGKTKIYFLPGEGIADDSEYQVMYPNNRIYDNINSIFFWGKNPYLWFKNNRKIDDINKLKKTGFNRAPISKAYSEISTKDKNKIGFIGRFPAMNDLYGRNPMWFFLIENSIEEVDKSLSRLKSESEAMFLYLEIFNKITEESDYIISYRPHPNENLKTYEMLASKYQGRFELNQDHDVSEWISKCDKIVGIASSSFIDASIQKTPVICIDEVINIKSSTAKFDPILRVVYDYSYNPKDRNDLFKLIFDKNLKSTNNLNYKKTIDDNLTGDSSLVFDKIYLDLSSELSKSIIFDFINLNILKTLDFILLMYQKVFEKNSTQFDYSSFFHKVSDKLKLITKSINNKY